MQAVDRTHKALQLFLIISCNAFRDDNLISMQKLCPLICFDNMDPLHRPAKPRLSCQPLHITVRRLSGLALTAHALIHDLNLALLLFLLLSPRACILLIFDLHGMIFIRLLKRLPECSTEVYRT